MKNTTFEAMFRRIMALLLCLAMVLPLCISGSAVDDDHGVDVATQGGQETAQIEKQTASNEKDVYYVVAGSDFQAANHTQSAQNVTNILSAIKSAGYSTMDGLLFAGDYSNGWSYSYETAGVAALKNAVNGVYSGLADSASAVYLQGNHDVSDGFDAGLLSAGGAHDTDGYGVFLINEDDFKWSNESTEAGTKLTAARLATYLNGKISQSYTKPIFVLTHVPLHFTMRTVQNGDSRYASYLFDVLNAAGEAGLNIIVLYGHNHSASWEDSHGGSAVFYTKGDYLNVPQSQTTLAAKQLYFTYMNAGYVGYYSTPNTGVENTLTMSLFEITKDAVKISRYSSNGIYGNLKSAGVANTGYTTHVESNYFQPNYTVVSSPKTIALNKTINHGAVGVKVTVNNAEKKAVAVQGVSQIPAGYSAYVTYDINVDGFAAGTTAKVTIPVGDAFDEDRPVVVIDHEKKSCAFAEIENGTVTFTTDHFSLYSVAQSELTATSTWNGKITKFLQTVEDGEQLKTGVPYVITEKDSSGSYQWMLTNESATKVVGSVTNTGLLLDNYADTSTSHVWYYDGHYIRYGAADGPYLLLNYNSSTKLHTVSLSNTLDADAAAMPVPVAGTNKFVFQRSDGTSIFLNRYGGTSTSNVALTYTYSGSSQWCMNEVVSNANVKVNISAPKNTLSIGQSMQLMPSATIGTKETSNVSVTWRSLDPSVATVSSSGVVTPLKAGQVYIRATLEKVEGSNVSSLVYADILLTAVKEYADKYVVSAATHFGQQQLAQADPVAGGTYLIDFYSVRGWYLSGTQIAPGDVGYNGLSNKSGLEAVNHVPLYDGRWYFDGTNLYHGDAVAEDKCLVFTGDRVSIGAVGTNSEAFAVEAGSGASLRVLKVSSGKLNLFGGVPYNVPYLYNGHNDMRFFTVIADRVVELSVTPGQMPGGIGVTKAAVASVTVDGVETDAYSINWASSDQNVATVDSGGKITGVASGKAVVTATLTAIDGVKLNTPLSVEIPVEIPEMNISGNYAYNSMLSNPVLEMATTLEEGVPYVVTSNLDGARHMVLTTLEQVSALDARYSGFKLTDYANVSDKYVWYVEKETVNGSEKVYLRFGNLTDTNNYLGAEYIGVNDSNVNMYKLVLTSKDSGTPIFSTLIANNDGSYRPRAVSKDYVYLNQWGGAPNDTAVATRGWPGDWRFNVMKEPAEVSLWATPSSAELYAGDSIDISSMVKVNGTQIDTANYNLVYLSSNPGVATVRNGKIYGLREGTTVINVMIDWVKDAQLFGSNVKDSSCRGMVVSIPVTVHGPMIGSTTSKQGYLPVNASERMQVFTAADAAAGMVLSVYYGDGTTKQIPLLVSYLRHADGTPVDTNAVDTLKGLQVVYQGVTLMDNFTLNVYKSEKPDYPEYPNEGAVVIDKTAEGVDFQSSGLAQVELSLNGIPVKPGADVIVMLDTSSSMTVSRLNALTKSLNEMITTLRSNGPDGSPMDFRIAIADFNAYYRYGDTPYDLGQNDTTINNTVRSQAAYYSNSSHGVYTGDKKIGIGAFMDVHAMVDNPFYFEKQEQGVMHKYEGESGKAYSLTTHTGTNYDYAFDVIYELGKAVSDHNASNGEKRELYVIFMSDGAPFQYNFFSSQSGNQNGAISAASAWNNWIIGTMTDEMFKPDVSVDPFNGARNDYYHPDGKHWMAEAIKGSREDTFKVIRKNDPMDEDGDNWIEIKGLDATLYSIGLCLQDDHEILTSSMETVIKNVATSEKHANFADENQLANVFSDITNEIMNAVSDAYFVDTLGGEYDLLMRDLEYELNGVKTIFSDSKIQVKAYEIYTTADYENGLCTWTQIGVRKTDASGKPICSVLEEVTFNSDGTAAYSDGDQSVNIFKNGVICAKNFWYNTSATSAKSITLDNGTAYSLAPETFYWKVGNISTTELALSYYVYLTRAQGENGGRYAGLYNTNEDATLYYENYLGNDCHLIAPIPELLWEQAKVGYSFYLVDKNGNPVVNDSTGAIGSFVDSKKLLDAVSFEFTTNGEPQVLVAADFMKALADAGYELYDPAARYSVDLNSDGFGRLSVLMDEDCSKQTTYVTGLGEEPAVFGDHDESVHEFDDFATANTVVWFAVRPVAKAVPDVVVIDYGLDVVIDVLKNDNCTGGTGTLSKVVNAAAFKDAYEAALATNPALTMDGYLATLDHKAACALNTTASSGVYGSASVTDDGNVRYNLSAENGMHMDKEDIFVYAMKYTGGPEYAKGYYYSTVTVIPATTIYYEDNFGSVSYSAYEYDVTDKTQTILETDSVWAPTNADAAISDQDTDRPGALNEDDANNIYGADGAYKSMAQFSMGSGMKFTAKQEGNIKTVGLAEFSFTGTGFDIISMSSNTTGTVFAAIYKTSDLAMVTNRPIPASVKAVDTIVVDTYYGYKYVDSDNDGFHEWVPAAAGEGEDAKLYQVPVIKKSGLEYGDYTVVLTVTYSYIFDHNQYAAEQYDFYLDAIRIYDPANDGSGNSTIQGAYTEDKEGWPEYFELRNLLIKRGDLDYTNEDGSVSVAGVAFMDSATTADKAYDITNYLNFGPNNELYLTKGQAIAFKLDVTDDTMDAIHMAMKCVGSQVDVEYYNLLSDGVTQEDYTKRTISTSTDLYYDITALNGDVVVIKNTSDGILSITNVKVTYSEAHEDTMNDSFFTVDQKVVDQVLGSLNTIQEEEELPDADKPIKIGSLSLSLESEVIVNLYYTLNGISAENAEMGLLTWDSEPETVSYEKAQTVVKGFKSDGTRYMVCTNGIPAKNMGDDIYMCVYINNDGNYTYSDLITYSPKQYAMSRLAKSSDETLKRLCVALLNYGAEAQKYFTYKTNDLMNAALTAEQLALVPAYNDGLLSNVGAVNASKVGTFVKTAGYGTASVTLSMDGDIALNYYVKPANAVDGEVTFYYWNAKAYEDNATLTAENATGTVKMQRVINVGDDTVSYWANIDGIAAKNMEDVYYVAATFTSGGASCCTGVIPYSVAKYCENKAAGNGSMKTLAQTLAVYGYCAREYFKKEA